MGTSESKELGQNFIEEFKSAKTPEEQTKCMLKLYGFTKNWDKFAEIITVKQIRTIFESNTETFLSIVSLVFLQFQ